MERDIHSWAELFASMVWSDLRLRYKGTLLGFLWTFIRPLFIISILLFVFTRLFRPDVSNYPAYLITGFIVWNFFAVGTNALASITTKKSLVKKISFPKELIVLSDCTVTLIHSVIEFAVLLIVLAFVNVRFGASLIFLPALILLQYIFIIGLSFLLSSLYVRFRDLNHIWRVILEALFYATPIIYPNSLLMKDYPLLLILNPMAHFITNYREILLNNHFIGLPAIAILLSISMGYLAIGLVVFTRKKDYFAEEV